jgi:hypothetical protein
MPIKRLNSVHVCLVAELRNTKHERSAQEFSRGTTTTAAAGCVKNADGQGAYRLSKRADVQAPLAEIQRECEHINAGSTELAIDGIRHGGLTKAGNSAAPLLAEKARCYLFPARVSRDLRLRQQNPSAANSGDIGSEYSGE